MTEEEIRERIKEGKYLIPEYMWGGLERYLINRIPPGDFLTALLSNDLLETFARADSENQNRVLDYVIFLYNFAPRGCYGSPEAVKAWLEGHSE